MSLIDKVRIQQMKADGIYAKAMDEHQCGICKHYRFGLKEMHDGTKVCRKCHKKRGGQ